MKRILSVYLVLLMIFFTCSGCTMPEKLTAFLNQGSPNDQSLSQVIESPALAPQEQVGNNAEAGEMRAIWITQFEISPIRSAEEEPFRNTFAAMMKNCADYGLNTVFVQVRPNGDAFYPSELYPWSYYISGAAGQGLGYDPLTVMVEEAHKAGLKFHAWINPYRLQVESQMQQISTNYQTRRWYDKRDTSDKVVVINGTCYLNPGYSETRQLIIDGVKEIVKKYEVDGIHIDDYFYPTTEETFDAIAVAANAGGKSVSDFRFDNVDQTVKGIYEGIRSVRGDVVFGVSPAGNIDNNLNKLYANVKKWAAEPGYLDYIIPQIYWNYDHTTMPFLHTLQNWNELTTAENVKLIPGLAAYKLDSESWTGAGSVLGQMVTDSRAQSHYGGFALYSYSAMFTSSSDVMQMERSTLFELLESD